MRCFVALAIALSQSATAMGQQPDAVAPHEDDAALQDVQFIGQQLGWAVGDHGVVMRTLDGGRSWNLLRTNVTCQLRSLCFLTDRVGWIAGGETIPYTRIGRGVVLFTKDGGETWQQLAEDQLPQLHAIKFFSLENGIAIGATSPKHPTGMFVTSDGGRSWKNFGSQANAGWRTAEFPRDGIGVVAGMRGQVRSIVGRDVLPPRFNDFGLRGVHDISMLKDGTGWLVGDGGLVRYTPNGGTVWQSLDTLPRHLREAMDFHAVATHGKRIWIAGSPGSIIWHSADDGRSWTRQFTNQNQPINSVTFTSQTDGVAVGELGLILRTNDGGSTWTTARGANRWIAFACYFARSNQLPLKALAKFCGDLGYRSVAMLVPRHDIGADGQANRDLDVQINDAVTKLLVAGAETGWQLPLLLPNLDRNRDRLIDEWNRQTEGKLESVVLGQLVRHLRTWKPSVVVLHEPDRDDAVTQVLNQAVMRAVKLAGDGTQFIDHYELAGLSPWQVNQVFVRSPDGSANVDPNEILPRLNQTVQDAATDAASILPSASTRLSARESFRLIYSSDAGSIRQVAAGGLLSGIGIAPGTAARRSLATVDDAALEHQIAIGKRRRNFRAYVERMTDDSRAGAQLLAELTSTTAGMSETQAVRQYLDLFERFHSKQQLELATSVCLELVQRFPNQPAAHDAARWLVQQWCSSEATWHRMRNSGLGKTKTTIDKDKVAREFKNAIRDKNNDPIDSNKLNTSKSQKGRLNINKATEWDEATIAHQQGQAIRIAGLLRQKAPQLFRRPQLSFPLASAFRKRGNPSAADAIFRRFEHAAEPEWMAAAGTELWLSNPIGLPAKQVQLCRPTGDRPLLDAVIGDPCWQDADVLRLKNSASTSQIENSIVMLSYDRDYLYVAASMPRVAGVNYEKTIAKGREHDADLTDFDRLTIYLDIDRDYSTSFAIHIDQRGAAAESCVGDTTWNPEMYIAARLDQTHWRVEVAIPFSEFTKKPPQQHALWAVGLVRTIPAFGYSSWTGQGGSEPTPRTFGLIKFD